MKLSAFEPWPEKEKFTPGQFSVFYLIIDRFSELLNDASHSVFMWQRSFRNWFAQELADRLPAVLDPPNEKLVLWAIVHDVLIVHPKNERFLNRLGALPKD